MEEIKNIILQYNEEIISLSIFFIVFCVLYYFRRKKIIKTIAIEIIQERVKYLNSVNGQKKIEVIEKELNQKIEILPFYLKVFLLKFTSKASIVTIIEKTLNELQDLFDKEIEDVDIIGNEEVKKKV